jgi:nucleotide-binding universal stress UspA family protein
MIYLPVLIVRAYNHPETEGAEICYSRILLPIDSSRRAESALSAGIVLAQGETKFQSVSKKTLPGTADSATELTSVAQEPKLYLAAVISPPEIPIPAPYPAEIRKLSDQLLQVSRKAVRAYLDGMKLHLPVECEIRVVESSNITTAVQDLADQENIDLVLMSAHGYTGQSTWPYGSVARNFIEHGTKPVLIIQDVSRTHVQPTAAAIAAEKSGGR